MMQMWSCKAHLVAANQVDDDGQIGQHEQPPGLEEAKAGQQIAWCVIAEGCIAQSSDGQVVGGRNAHANS